MFIVLNNKKIKFFLIAVAVSALGIFYYPKNKSHGFLSIPSAPFYFIRHGQTDHNIKKLVAGKTDTPLNETGVKQAHAAAELLKKTNIRTIISSPLQRARKTAEIIASTLDKPIIIIDELVERSAGSFEGKPQGLWTLRWIYDHYEIPDDENYSDFKQRVLRGLQKALQYPGPVLIVAHGGVFDMIQNFLQLDHDKHIENATPLFIAPLENQLENQCDSWYYNYLSLV
jgi:probable phosphoglycerate mutase